MKFEDNTNVDNAYQGKLRFAPLDVAGLMGRCSQDAGGKPFNLVLTHCDQLAPPCPANFYAYGPTRNRFTLDATALPPAKAA